jgi:hypothetical protein
MKMASTWAIKTADGDIWREHAYETAADSPLTAPPCPVCGGASQKLTGQGFWWGCTNFRAHIGDLWCWPLAVQNQLASAFWYLDHPEEITPGISTTIIAILLRIQADDLWKPGWQRLHSRGGATRTIDMETYSLFDSDMCECGEPLTDGGSGDLDCAYCDRGK